MPGENLMEKVSVNINSATLSQIDLLVDNGYYSNRSDFINQALRSSLLQQQSTLDRLIDANSGEEAGDPWFLGVYGITARALEEDIREGRRYSVRGYGVLIISGDCPNEQVFAVIDSIQVKGKIICDPAIKAHYGLK